jgi:hypothetical protein
MQPPVPGVLDGHALKQRPEQKSEPMRMEEMNGVSDDTLDDFEAILDMELGFAPRTAPVANREAAVIDESPNTEKEDHASEEAQNETANPAEEEDSNSDDGGEPEDGQEAPVSEKGSGVPNDDAGNQNDGASESESDEVGHSADDKMETPAVIEEEEEGLEPPQDNIGERESEESGTDDADG